MFSIIIPTWNNLEFLKLCVRSIKENSQLQHQILLHINDGCDGTLDWAKKQGIEHTHSIQNIGICFAVNQAAALAKFDYIVYMNDDMYVCPEWDKILLDEIQSLSTENFMLSSTMIEPAKSRNTCVIVEDFGSTVESFDEERLLREYKNLEKMLN